MKYCYHARGQKNSDLTRDHYFQNEKRNGRLMSKVSSAISGQLLEPMPLLAAIPPPPSVYFVIYKLKRWPPENWYNIT